MSVGIGVTLGDGDPVPLMLGDGLGDSDGDGVLDGDGFADFDGAALGEAPGDPERDVQPGDDEPDEVLSGGVCPPFLPRLPECRDAGSPLPETPPRVWFLVTFIRAVGTVVTAKDKPTTTRNAALSAAAGRSHLTQPVPPSSGRNCSMKSANIYHTRSTTAQNAYHVRMAIDSRCVATTPSMVRMVVR